MPRSSLKAPRRLQTFYRNSTKLARLALGVRSRVPREVQLEVTNRCNLDCDMCPRLVLLQVPEIDMTRETLDAILGRFAAAEAPPHSITLTGWGEPLMHAEFFEFVDRISERLPSTDVGFTTNAHLLTRRVGAKVLARPAITRINVSLEELPWEDADARGPVPVDERTGNPQKGENNYVARDGHSTPPKVVDHLEHFLRERNAKAARGEPAPEVRLQVVLFPNSEEITRRLIDFGADAGFQAINLVRLDVRGRPDLSRPSFEEERRLISLARARAKERGILLGSINDHGHILRLASHTDNFCIRLDSYVYVDVEGNVAPCCLLRGHRLGNLSERTLSEVWTSPEFKRFYGPGVHPACEGCDAFMHTYMHSNEGSSS
jgi:MoaA/NifB/PqqE/SkfB family radical SAM enzyme